MTAIALCAMNAATDGGTMASKRFPNYQPSTALRQAITAYREAQKRRAQEPGELGGPGLATPGREGTDTGAADEGSRHGQAGQPGQSDTNALASERQGKKGE